MVKDKYSYVIVTRHQALVKYLLRYILPEIDGARALPHVENPNQIEGKHVIGNLPLHLAAHARSITIIPLILPPQLRGAELSVEEVTKYAEEPRTFVVEEVNLPWQS